MDLISAILLGILQGATEFLPISSSGHLVIAEDFFHVEQASLMFDVALHMGTLLAVIFYFRVDLRKMLAAVCRPGSKDIQDATEKKKVIYLSVATVPAVIAGLLFEDVVETALRHPALVAGTLVVFGLLLLWADKQSDHTRDFQSITLKDAIIIGAAQALAIIPGVSRSGITMTAGLFRSLDRQAVARFSFLMSVPVIAGAGVLNCLKIMRHGLNGDQLLFFSIGFLASAISGYLFISFLMKYIQTRSFAVFAYYRFVLAGTIIIYLYYR